MLSLFLSLSLSLSLSLCAALAYGKVDYDDVRIPFSEWGALKGSGTLPFDSVPTLRLPSGLLVSQVCTWCVTVCNEWVSQVCPRCVVTH